MGPPNSAGRTRVERPKSRGGAALAGRVTGREHLNHEDADEEELMTHTNEPYMTNLDIREQLYNDRKTGTLAEVQLPLERITTLHGILFDLDPGLYRRGNMLFPPADDPKEFHDLIRPVLDRHPLARAAEVRASGTGLHIIVWLDPPAELRSAGEQQYWDAAVRAVQCTLPVDPNSPGVTALTRAAGSVNTKNGRGVEVLRRGESVTACQVVEFVKRVAKAPFREAASILLGDVRVRPCPVCRVEGSRLDVLDHVGVCYTTCGKVKLWQLFDRVFAPRKGADPADAGGACAAPTSARPADRRQDDSEESQERRATGEDNQPAPAGRDDASKSN
jgi:hypothetical protein